MKSARARPAALIGFALAIAVGGCGGSSKHARVTGGKLDLVMREYRLIPQHVDAPAGRLRITVRNGGVIAHRLAVGRGRFAVGRAATVFPGSKTTLTLRLPPGRYRMFCTLSNHDTLGMYGSLVVH